jgi:hypothetical protein
MLDHPSVVDGCFAFNLVILLSGAENLLQQALKHLAAVANAPFFLQAIDLLQQAQLQIELDASTLLGRFSHGSRAFGPFYRRELAMSAGKRSWLIENALLPLLGIDKTTVMLFNALILTSQTANRGARQGQLLIDRWRLRWQSVPCGGRGLAPRHRRGRGS